MTPAVSELRPAGRAAPYSSARPCLATTCKAAPRRPPPERARSPPPKVSRIDLCTTPGSLCALLLKKVESSDEEAAEDEAAEADAESMAEDCDVAASGRLGGEGEEPEGEGRRGGEAEEEVEEEAEASEEEVEEEVEDPEFQCFRRRAVGSERGSRSRSRCPSAASSAPADAAEEAAAAQEAEEAEEAERELQPRPKRRPKARPRPPRTPPPPEVQAAWATAQAEGHVAALRLATSSMKILGAGAKSRAKPQATMQQAAPATASRGPRLPRVARPAWQDAEERVAMQVLARHAARLGTSSLGMEQAVWAAHRQAGWLKLDGAIRRCWDFFDRADGMQAYIKEKRRMEKVFNDSGRASTKRADEEVRHQLTPASTIFGRPPPFPGLLKPGKFCVEAAPGSVIELPIQEVRFAHDAQSEHFGRGGMTGSGEGHTLLQLVIELLAGLTDPEAVPAFSVCRHEGFWYCRSGNRRLAAFRLAQRYAPGRFVHVRVQVVAVDHAFLRGTGKLPKFTTHRNGADCFGQWLLVRETGEAVGRRWQGACDEYGEDLLSLLAM